MNTKYEIVHPDVPEPEDKPRPVQLKLTMESSGLPCIWAKQKRGWIPVAFCSRDGRISRNRLTDDQVETLPGLLFAKNEWVVW